MPKRPKQPYDAEAMEKAVLYVQTRGGSIRAAARDFGVPKSSLQYRIKNPGHKDTLGPSTVLTEDEERTLVRWIKDLTRKGFPRKKEDLKTSVQEYLNAHPRPNLFKDNRPGDGWVKAFLRRHPEIAERKSEGVTAASACVSEKDIRGWFTEIQEHIKDNNLDEAMSDPSRVFNADETNFQVCPNTGKVLAPKGCKNVYSVEHGGSKDSLTVMFTFSANGLVCCPMIVYAYKRIPEKVANSVPHGWGIGRSDTGWMTAEVFFEYISNVFHPFLLEKQVKFPVVMFVDGHRTHLTYQVSKLCSELGIELIALYPNATRILQPADVAAFHPLKAAWRKAVREWQVKNPGDIVINKSNFASVLKDVVETSIRRESLINGFRVCGIHPFNPDAVDYSKCLPSQRRESGQASSVKQDAFITYTDFAEIVGEQRLEQFEKMKEILDGESHNEDFFRLFQLWSKFHENTRYEDNEAVLSLVSPTCAEKVAHTDSASANTSVTILEETVEETEGSQSANISEVTLNNKPEYTPIMPTREKSSSVLRSARSDSLGEFLVWPETPKRKGKRLTERYPFAITSQRYKLMFQRKQEQKQKSEREKEERKRKREQGNTVSNRNKKLNLQKNIPSKNIIQSRNKSNECDMGENASPPSLKTSNATSKTVTYNLKSPRHDHEHRPRPTPRNLFPEPSTSSKTECCVCKGEVGLGLVYEEGNLITCDKCKKSFHRKCIPKSHNELIPESDEEDFLCHMCYKLDDSDDFNSSFSCDVSSDDELLKLCGFGPTE